MGVRDDDISIVGNEMPRGIKHRLNVNGSTRVRGCNHTAC
jgi:hypothetical protein